MKIRAIRNAGLVATAGALALGAAGAASADSGAQGVAAGSPGVASGNVVQVPVHIPVNLCGNTVDVVGLLNPAFGNTCANVSGHGWTGRG
ncbi:chaplin [Streptomyces sp. NPDC017943]|uniref:chaplin n=1 Tax=Streptomyces sp. NPDC017943 TaxID=3365019 RepID=UPI00378DFFE1